MNLADHDSDVSDQLISVDDLDSEGEDKLSLAHFSASSLSYARPNHEDEPVSSSPTQFGSRARDRSRSSSTSPRFGKTGGASEGLSGGGLAAKLKKKAALANKCLDESELQHLRLKINSRERRRMHDLNAALDGLREVMPYAHGPSVRKLSKIATLLLARNYILMLNNSLEEMKKLDLPRLWHPRYTLLTTATPNSHPHLDLAPIPIRTCRFPWR
nr:hypothetical protein BaRGS_021421 [Batillaria attramentaria]